MAHDGCEEVVWKGQAFSYLLHHSGFLKTENYGTKRTEQHGSTSTPHQNLSDTQTKAGTGTWQGPAPKGFASSKKETVEDLARSAALEPAAARLGNGKALPFVGLGLAGVADKSVIEFALESGIRHFDCSTATVAEETVLGAGLAAFVSNGGREALFIAAPVRSAAGGAGPVPSTVPSAEDVKSSVSASLAALGVEYLDLLLLPAASSNAAAAVAAAWGAMQALVAEGKVKSLGVSNFSLRELEDLQAAASSSSSSAASVSSSSPLSLRPLVNQVELHPLLAQRKLVGVSLRKGVLSVAHSPLGGGAAELLAAPAVAAIATATGRTPAQVLLRWNVQRGAPVVVGIRGAADAEQQRRWIAEAATGARGWKLDYAQKASLDAIDASATSAAKKAPTAAAAASKRFFAPEGFSWADPEEGGAVKPSVVLIK